MSIVSLLADKKLGQQTYETQMYELLAILRSGALQSQAETYKNLNQVACYFQWDALTRYKGCHPLRLFAVKPFRINEQSSSLRGRTHHPHPTH
jgi:hypothetical protein